MSIHTVFSQAGEGRSVRMRFPPGDVRSRRGEPTAGIVDVSVIEIDASASYRGVPECVGALLENAPIASGTSEAADRSESRNIYSNIGFQDRAQVQQKLISHSRSALILPQRRQRVWCGRRVATGRSAVRGSRIRSPRRSPLLLRGALVPDGPTRPHRSPSPTHRRCRPPRGRPPTDRGAGRISCRAPRRRMPGGTTAATVPAGPGPSCRRTASAARRCRRPRRHTG